MQLAGRDGWGLTSARLGKPIRSILNKLEDTVRVTLDKRPVQRGESLLVRSVNAGTPSEEYVDALREALVSSPHQRRVTVGIDDIDGNALVEQENKEKHVAVESRDVKRVVALGIGNEGVGAVLQEQIDGVVVASLSSPLERSRDGFAALPVHLGAMFDKELAHGILVVDCSPL